MLAFSSNPPIESETELAARDRCRLGSQPQFAGGRLRGQRLHALERLRGLHEGVALCRCHVVQSSSDFAPHAAHALQDNNSNKTALHLVLFLCDFSCTSRHTAPSSIITPLLFIRGCAAAHVTCDVVVDCLCGLLAPSSSAWHGAAHRKRCRRPFSSPRSHSSVFDTCVIGHVITTAGWRSNAQESLALGVVVWVWAAVVAADVAKCCVSCLSQQCASRQAHAKG